MKRKQGGLRAVFRSLIRLFKGDKDSTVTNQGPDIQRLSGRLETDIQAIQTVFGHSSDLVLRKVPQPAGKPAVILFFIDGLVSKDAIAEYIIAPLVQSAPQFDFIDPESFHALAAEVGGAHTLKNIADALTLGKCVLLQDGCREAVTFGVAQWSHRAIEEPSGEPTVRGPREGFTEDLRTNITLLRRRLRTPAFRSERLVLGGHSHTQIQLVYLEGIARENIVAEVRSRIERIDTDAILDANYIDEYISDNPNSPFPSLQRTERPDRIVGDLLEGRVAILVDGSPIALSGPTTLLGLMQSSEDYYLRYYAASFAREIRWIAGVIGLLAPSLYVAVLSYHHELVPTQLLFTIAAGREGIPFPPVIEALFMEMAFEVLREAGLRMPQQIGPALSIVGVLVIGDAAVRAGLVSPLMIVVVGMTAIATFALPSNDLGNAVRLLRFPTMLMAGFLGLFGVFFAVMLLLGLLVSSRSLGVPYMSPYTPFWRRGLKDAMLRAPMWNQRDRPWHMVQGDQVQRQPIGQKPSPKKKRDRQ